jgi:phosphoribosyl-ATP pyrophosphohydrolase/phosphoribosyl-AMP cyclohydrolase
MAAAGVRVRPVLDPLAAAAFDSRGLVPVVVRDVRSGAVLMLAWANAEALAKTRSTGFSHFFSRSRGALWLKGETSGHVQRVVSIALDCDRDAVLYEVVADGPACHTGAVSCFEAPGAPVVKVAEPPSVRSIDLAPLFAVVAERIANPEEGSYTNKLLARGVGRVAQKVGEEGVETALAAVTAGDDELAGEIADLLYHVVVLMGARGLEPAQVAKKLESRQGKRRAE